MSKDKWVKDRWTKYDDSLYFGGDFSHDPEVEARQLAYARELNIVTFIDLRDEATEDDALIAADHGFRYINIPRDDDGKDIGPTWWNEFLNVMTEQAPAGPILVYCHMGINRAPSAIAAWLVHNPNYNLGLLEAWGVVRDLRPQAWASYYPDFLDNCYGPRARSVSIDIRNNLKKNAAKINRVIRETRRQSV